MNKQDRKELEKAIKLIEDAMDILDWVRFGHQEKMNNIPEGLQGTDRYQEMEDAQYTMDSEWDNLESVRDNIQELI
ncbi:MAG: hypothetical protein KBT28_00065 [Bacteroidales bacterium]|nr:hypothetical protein [Candidatus Colimorpha merdihippi]